MDLAASRKFPGRLYHVNDSGDAGTFDIPDGRENAQSVCVAGFDPRDTEALSLGPCPGTTLFVPLPGRYGDNDRRRKSLRSQLWMRNENFQPK